MYPSVRTHIVSFLLLATILIPRILNLHELDHLLDDDISISCELCDLVINSEEPLLIANDNSYEQRKLQNTPNTLVILRYYRIPQGKIVTPGFIYNKPPPIS